ncbi:MAG: MBL fold metallo-hydrolase [Flavobacteriales bacterium]|jgi:glyoxylase-like metal-dependent hydrolase (beta-lactamase superfamily II)|tara:strand:+ start:4005 stop:4844 length:840 start_codon:yes stop_codon:yes gene_type:complete
MKIVSIETGNFKLDGGAMFGVVPKSLWQRTNPADEHNLCPWSMRSMLVDYGDRKVLIDNGIGDKQSDKFFGHFHLHGEDTLHKSLAKHGYHPDDITDVFLTHLHFDHCGGGVKYNEKGALETVFKHATYWSNEAHWNLALNPNDREKASFLRENLLPMQESGQLDFIKTDGIFLPGFDVLFADGHTEAQMIPHIEYKDKTVVFAADLLPSVGHIPLPYVMGYDTRPLLTLQEKKIFLETAAQKGHTLFLEHDYFHSCCTVKETERGIKLDQSFQFEEKF